jgi:hypothetical protein
LKKQLTVFSPFLTVSSKYIYHSACFGPSFNPLSVTLDVLFVTFIASNVTFDLLNDRSIRFSVTFDVLRVTFIASNVTFDLLKDHSIR